MEELKREIHTKQGFGPSVGCLELSNKKTLAFTVRLPTRCVEIVDELIEAGGYSSRGECVRDIVRSAFREGFHRKMLPAHTRRLTPYAKTF
jgi:hypothetical protein